MFIEDECLLKANFAVTFLKLNLNENSMSVPVKIMRYQFDLNDDPPMRFGFIVS